MWYKNNVSPEEHTPAMHVARTPDGLCYAKAGSGPPLLYVLGMENTVAMEPPVLRSVLANHFTVYVFDHRGTGGSAANPPPTTLAGYADDAAALMDALGLPAAHVMGVSFGGAVAQHLALRHPARVKSLVLCACSAGGTAEVRPDLVAATEEEFVAKLLRSMDTREAEVDAATVTREVARRRARGAAAASGTAAQMAARACHDTAAELCALACPTLVMGGKYDGIVRPEDVCRLAACIPGAEVLLYEGGHMFFRDAFGDVHAWLSSIPDA